MKKAPLFLGAGLAAALAWVPLFSSGNHAQQNAEARPAPAFSLKDQGGVEISLDSFGDKLVLLDFWAAWCTPCLKAVPMLNKVALEHAETIAVVGVSIDQRGRAVALEAAKKHKMQYPVVQAGDDLARQYQVEAIPYLVAVKNGQIVKTLTGSHTYRELMEALKPLL